MKRFAVEALPEGESALSADASHHAVHVCRLAEGAEIALFDGLGHELTAQILAITDGIATVRPIGAPRRTAPPRSLHLVLGLPKGPSTDDAIRMATEAGVTEVHLVWAARTQGRPDRVDRWQRIAESAAAQSGRADVPIVHRPTTLAIALDRLEGQVLCIALPGSEGGPDEPAAGVLIGPEGGWSRAEVELALHRGAKPISLGRWVLRSCTAAAIAVALIAGT